MAFTNRREKKVHQVFSNFVRLLHIIGNFLTRSIRSYDLSLQECSHSLESYDSNNYSPLTIRSACSSCGYCSDDTILEETSGDPLFSSYNLSAAYSSVLHEEYDCEKQGIPLDRIVTFLVIFFDSGLKGRISSFYNFIMTIADYSIFVEAHLDSKDMLDDMRKAMVAILKERDVDSTPRPVWTPSGGVHVPANFKKSDIKLNKDGKFYVDLIDKATNKIHLGCTIMDPTSGKLESFLDAFDSFLDVPTKFFQDASLIQVRKLLTYMLFYIQVPDKWRDVQAFLSLYDGEYYDKLARHGDNVENIINILKTVSYLIRRTFVDESYFPNATDPTTFIKNVEWLRKFRFKRDISPDPNDSSMIDNRLYIKRLSDTYRSRLTFLRNVDRSLDKPLLMFYIRILDEIYDKEMNKNTGKRDIPFVIGLNGDSQSGKTTVLGPYISQIIQDVYGIPTSSASEGFKILAANDKYLSSYDPERDKVVMFDEMGNYVEDRENYIVNQFLQMASGGEVILNDAAVEMKGKREFKPQGLLVCSNISDFGLKDVLKTVSAGFNRFNGVYTVVIKSEYVVGKAGGMKRKKIEENQSLLIDKYGLEKAMTLDEYWPIRIMVNELIDGQWAIPSDFSTISVPEFFDKIRCDCIAHKKHSEASLRRKMINFLKSKCNECDKFICNCTKEGNTESPEMEDIYLLDTTAGEYVDPIIRGLVETDELLVDEMALSFSEWLYSNFCFIISVLLYALTIPVTFLLKYDILWMRWIWKQVLTRWYWKILAARADYYRQCQFARMRTQLVKNIYRYEKITEELIKNELYQKINTRFVAKVFLTVGGLTILFKILRKTVWNQTAGTFMMEERDSKERNAALGRIPSRIVCENKSIWNPDNKNEMVFGKSSLTPENTFYSKVCNSVLKGHFVDDAGSKITTHLFFVKEGYYLTVKHWYESIPSKRKVRFSKPDYKDGYNYDREVCIVDKEALECVHVKDDLVLIRIFGINSPRSMFDYFLKDIGSLTNVSGVNTIIDFENNEYRNTSLQGSMSSYNTTIGSYTGVVGLSDYPSFKGRCGSPLTMCIDQKFCILGINVAGLVGRAKNAYAIVNQQELQRAIDSNISSLLAVTSGLIVENTVLNDYDLIPVNKKSEVFWLDIEQVGGIQTYGCAKEITVPRPSSKVYQLPTYKAYFDIMPKEYHHDLVAPNFKSYLNSDGEWKGVYRNMLTEMNFQASNINASHLSKIIEHLIVKFDVDDFENLEFWDIDHACSGATYNYFCKPLPKNTGAGFPYGGKKIDWMVPSESEFAPDGFVPNEEMKLKVHNYIERLKTGNHPGTVYKTCFKDEPRDRTKVAERKIRVFTVAPMHQMIVHKMFFGQFMGIFVRNFINSETVGGINMWSKQWGEAYEYLSVHPNVINGDFSKYDKKAASVMINGAITIMYRIMKKRMNLGPEWDTVFSAIAADISNPVILMENCFLQVPGSLSSGILMTFIVNNIINSMLIRLAWMDTGESLDQFDQSVRFLAMGDDNTMTVSDKYIEKFNFTTLHKFFKKVGIKYTNAEKTDSMYGSVTMDYATICKRKFVYDKEYDHWLAPIEKASIGKMVTMAIKGGPLNDIEKVLASITSAQYELCQYGKNEFDARIEDLKTILEMSNINHSAYGYHWFDYHELMNKIIKEGSVPWDKSNLMVEQDMLQPNA